MMPKSKFYMSPSTNEAASFNGGGADAVGEGLASLPNPMRKKCTSEEHTTSLVAAGRLPEGVYANMLPWWRAALRRKCVSVVEWESKVIGEWQVRSFFSSLFFPPFSTAPPVGRRLAREARGRSSHCLW
jgi:hypothetical protein